MACIHNKGKMQLGFDGAQNCEIKGCIYERSFGRLLRSTLPRVEFKYLVSFKSLKQLKILL